jgi:cell division protease FtsH
MSSRLGFVNYAGSDTREAYLAEKDYSPETARVIDEEIRGLIDAAYAEAERMVAEHWDRVVAIAEALLKHETLQRDDVDRLMRGERLDRPTVAEMLSLEAARPARPAPPPPARDPAHGGELGPGTGPFPTPA